MNVIYHPTATLANFIVNHGHSQNSLIGGYGNYCGVMSLRLLIMPAFLLIELIFKAIPQHLYLQFTADQNYKDKSTENIQKLFNGIFFQNLNHSIVHYNLEAITFSLMSIEDQHRLIIRYPKLFEYASIELRQNRETVLHALQLDGELLKFVSEELKQDPDIVRIAIENNYHSLRFASNNLRGNLEFIQPLVAYNGQIIRYATNGLRNNYNLVLDAVRADGAAVFWASNDLKNHRDIVLAAVQNGGSHLIHPNVFRDNPHLFLEVLAYDGLLLYYASPEFKNHPDTVLCAIQNNPLALQYASQELQSNKDIVMCAIQNNPLALQYASFSLRDDDEIILAAVQINGCCVKYASNRLKNDRRIVLNAVKNNINALKKVPVHFRNDYEIILEAVKINGLALKFASLELRDNRDIVITAVRNKPVILKFASDALKRDPEIYSIYLHRVLPESLSKFEDKQYIPKVLSPELKSIQLPQLPEFATLEHLRDSLRTFINDLQDSQLEIIKSELGRQDLTLRDAKDQLLGYHAQLFHRLSQRTPYLGTPPAGTLELNKFYENIELYLKHLHVFLSKEENRPPEALIERLQILQTQTACGARFQSELEQLFSLNCMIGECMKLDKQCALIASTCLKKSIESMAQGSNVHQINIINWQLDEYLVGDRIVRDWLAHPIEEFQLKHDFFTRHTALNIIDHVQKALKPGSDIDLLFSEYIKENFAIKLTDQDRQLVEEQAKELWQDFLEVKMQKFSEYKNVKSQNGIYGHIQSNATLLAIFNLTEDEASCQSVEELNRKLEAAKDTTLASFLEDALSDYTIEKIYNRYFDELDNKWSKAIIALSLEKMGILQAI